MIVSGEQQRDSAIVTQVSILCQTPLPSRLPHNTEQSSLLYGRSLLVIYFTHSSVSMSIPNSLTIPSPHPSLSNHKLVKPQSFGVNRAWTQSSLDLRITLTYQKQLMGWIWSLSRWEMYQKHVSEARSCKIHWNLCIEPYTYPDTKVRQDYKKGILQANILDEYRCKNPR